MSWCTPSLLHRLEEKHLCTESFVRGKGWVDARGGLKVVEWVPERIVFVGRFQRVKDWSGCAEDVSRAKGVPAMASVGDGEPSSPEKANEDLMAMCTRLGMDIEHDPDDKNFVWIAEQALQQVLPPGWAEYADDEGYAYFHNETTGETQWEPPMTKHFITLYNRLKLEAKRIMAEAWTTDTHADKEGQPEETGVNHHNDTDHQISDLMTKNIELKNKMKDLQIAFEKATQDALEAKTQAVESGEIVKRLTEEHAKNEAQLKASLEAAQTKIPLTLLNNTRALLQPLMVKPKITNKLLRRPPFRFLHDIITNVANATGFGNGLFSGEELVSKSFQGHKAKVGYMQKIIDCVSIALGESIEARPSKIISGVEVEATCAFLEALGRAATNKNIDSDEAVRRVLVGVSTKDFQSGPLLKVDISETKKGLGEVDSGAKQASPEMPKEPIFIEKEEETNFTPEEAFVGLECAMITHGSMEGTSSDEVVKLPEPEVQEPVTNAEMPIEPIFIEKEETNVTPNFVSVECAMITHCSMEGTSSDEVAKIPEPELVPDLSLTKDVQEPVTNAEMPKRTLEHSVKESDVQSIGGSKHTSLAEDLPTEPQPNNDSSGNIGDSFAAQDDQLPPISDDEARKGLDETYTIETNKQRPEASSLAKANTIQQSDGANKDSGETPVCRQPMSAHHNVGDVVKLKSIISAPDLTGKHAYIQGYSKKHNRYYVELVDNSDTKVLLIKADMLDCSSYEDYLETIDEQDNRHGLYSSAHISVKDPFDEAPLQFVVGDIARVNDESVLHEQYVVVKAYNAGHDRFYVKRLDDATDRKIRLVMPSALELPFARLQGLEAHADLNGVIVQVVGFHKKYKRYGIRVCRRSSEHAALMMVRVEHIKPCTVSKLVGLKRAPQFNDHHVTIRGYDQKHDRFYVKLLNPFFDPPTIKLVKASALVVSSMAEHNEAMDQRKRRGQEDAVRSRIGSLGILRKLTASPKLNDRFVKIVSWNDVYERFAVNILNHDDDSGTFKDVETSVCTLVRPQSVGDATEGEYNDWKRRNRNEGKCFRFPLHTKLRGNRKIRGLEYALTAEQSAPGVITLSAEEEMMTYTTTFEVSDFKKVLFEEDMSKVIAEESEMKQFRVTLSPEQRDTCKNIMFAHVELRNVKKDRRKLELFLEKRKRRYKPNRRSSSTSPLPSPPLKEVKTTPSNIHEEDTQEAENDEPKLPNIMVRAKCVGPLQLPPGLFYKTTKKMRGALHNIEITHLVTGAFQFDVIDNMERVFSRLAFPQDLYNLLPQEDRTLISPEENFERRKTLLERIVHLLVLDARKDDHRKVYINFRREIKKPKPTKKKISCPVIPKKPKIVFVPSPHAKKTIVLAKRPEKPVYNLSKSRGFARNQTELDQDPWEEHDDPQGSGLKYWWNTETNEVTRLGATKPGIAKDLPADKTDPAVPVEPETEDNANTGLTINEEHDAITSADDQDDILKGILGSAKVAYDHAVAKEEAIETGPEVRTDSRDNGGIETELEVVTPTSEHGVIDTKHEGTAVEATTEHVERRMVAVEATAARLKCGMIEKEQEFTPKRSVTTNGQPSDKKLTDTKGALPPKDTGSADATQPPVYTRERTTSQYALSPTTKKTTMVSDPPPARSTVRQIRFNDSPKSNIDEKEDTSPEQPETNIASLKNMSSGVTSDVPSKTDEVEEVIVPQHRRKVMKRKRRRKKRDAKRKKPDYEEIYKVKPYDHLNPLDLPRKKKKRLQKPKIDNMAVIEDLLRTPYTRLRTEPNVQAYKLVARSTTSPPRNTNFGLNDVSFSEIPAEAEKIVFSPRSKGRGQLGAMELMNQMEEEMEKFTKTKPLGKSPTAFPDIRMLRPLSADMRKFMQEISHDSANLGLSSLPSLKLPTI